MGSSTVRNYGSGGSGSHGSAGSSTSRSYGAGASGHTYSGSAASHVGPGAPGSRNYSSNRFSPSHGGSANLSHHDGASHGYQSLGQHSSHDSRDANFGHHSWDQHFTHNNWNHDWAAYHHCYHHYPYPYFAGAWPFWFPSWDYYGYYPYASNYVYYYDGGPQQWATYSMAAEPVAEPPVAPPPEAAEPSTATSAEQPADDSGPNALEFYNAARAEFKKGNYRNALRMASHAAVESPQNAKIHELNSLALLGLGDYRGAAIEAHGAIALGPISDWTAVYGYFDDAEKYTKTLRALETYAKAHPALPETRFLLGYQYLLIGAQNDAKSQMREAVKLTPKDKLAAYVLQQLEAGRPVTPPPPEPAIK